MKNVFISFLFFFLLANVVQAQCPTGSLDFVTQQQVNDFAVQYPNCTELSGSVMISGPDIFDLRSFNNITTIGGSLLILNCPFLTHFNGFEALTQIDGMLNVSYNASLIDITRIAGPNLGVAGGIRVNHNPQLTQCYMNRLCSGGGGAIYFNGEGCFYPAEIYYNCEADYSCINRYVGDLVLNSQAEVNSVSIGCSKIVGSLTISGDDIVDISKLSRITTITGDLTIENNPMLTSIAALEDLDFASIPNLTIQNNPLLTTCDVRSICRYAQYGDSAIITNNGTGCSSASEIIAACSEQSACPPNLFFFSQMGVNDFPNSYPDCTEIEGDLYIASQDYELVSDVSDLTPLSQLTRIGGTLNITGNPLLPNVNGLENITIIGGKVEVSNNDNLLDINGLSGVQSFVKGINVSYNSSLSECSVPFICNHDTNIYVTTSYNASGCDSYAEAQSGCTAMPCQSGDIILNTQQQVDNFAATYGGYCYEGTLQIGSTSGGLTDIDDLRPLSDLTYVNNLSIQRTNLRDLSGLEQLHVDDDLTIVLNPNLINVDALNCISNLGGQLHIGYNKELVTLDGLSGLSAANSVRINNNNKLASLSALDNLEEVSELIIQNNPMLTSLRGLHEARDTTLTNIIITSNPLLEACAFSNICTYLSNDGSNIIQNNAPGCANYADLGDICGFTDPCYIGNTLIESQQALNDFAAMYSGCPELRGRLELGKYTNTDINDLTPLSFITSIETLEINRSSISNLNGLEQLQHIDNLSFWRNSNLSDISALSGITSIDGILDISSHGDLLSLTGLNQLTSVGILSISSVPINSFVGLENLQMVRKIYLRNNYDLTSLQGLEGVNPDHLEYLSIRSNSDLVVCSLPNICEYLSNGGLNFIHNNYTALGCRSFAEFEIGCSDGCPAGDVILQTQQEVNDFAATYPTCTEIQGTLYIGKTSGSLTDITDLTPLNQIESVGGISIQRTKVSNLSGLEQLQTIDGDLRIVLNPNLLNINVLSGVASVGGQLHVGYNRELVTLMGLNELNTVGSLRINNNNKLANLSDLMNLQTVPEIIIQNNNILTSLAGLEGISSAALNNLTITSNPLLSDCAISPVCEHIGNQGFTLIGNNTGDCTTSVEVGAACSPDPDCPFGTTFLTTQQEVNDFAIMYANCNVIPDALHIGSSSGNLTNITDISPLSFITSVSEISVQRTQITNLTGLENLQNVDGDMVIVLNPSLLNLNALSNLSNVGGTLSIGYNKELTTLEGLHNLNSTSDLFVKQNNKLVSLEALSNLTYAPYLRINDNPVLPSLAGLENVDHTSLDFVWFTNNPQLSICSIAPVCNYLEDTPSSGYVYGNAAGCLSRAEILDICAASPPDDCDTAATIETETLLFDDDLFIDGVGFANNPNVAFTDPATPANAVLSDITLELFFRINGTSCEHEIDIKVTDPAGNVNIFSGLFASCNGMAGGLYNTTINIPSGNTTGNIDDWLIEFNDTNDQNTDYEYSLRFARLIYTSTVSEGEIIADQVSEFADYDLYVDGIGFGNNDNYTFADPGTPADAVLSDIQLELYFKLSGSSCENEIAIQITDPAGNTQPLTAFTTCIGGTDLYFVNLNVPSGNTTGNPADWVVEFDDTNDQNTGYEYSVRFGRLTYNTQYVECMEMMANESPQQLNNSSTHQFNNSSLKLYPVPANHLLNVEYFSENSHSTNIEIISNEGKIMMSQQEFLQEGLNTVQLDIADLPVGYYFIRMYGEDEMQTQPFVKVMP